MRAVVISNFLNDLLSVSKIKDRSKNGLQVSSKGDIKRVGFAVDGCVSTLRLAKDNNVDLLVVHHGLKWRGRFNDFGLNKIAVVFAKKNGIAVYAAHLPLDMHEVYGNNAQLAKILGLQSIKKFGRYKGRAIGYQGVLKRSLSPKQVAIVLNRKLKNKCKVLDFGKKKVRSIGIVSGGGSSAFKEAKYVDLFVTGDAPYHIFTWSRELDRNVIIAGHYASETVGVKSLMSLIKKTFKVDVIFLDNPLEG